MKIIYGKNFLEDIYRRDSFVEFTNYSFGYLHRYSTTSNYPTPEQLFEKEYYDDNDDLFSVPGEKELKKFPLEAIWEEPYLKMGLVLEDEDVKDIISHPNNGCHFLYVFYNNFRDGEQVAFILNNLYYDEYDELMYGRIDEEINVDRTFINVKLPTQYKGSFITNLTENSKLLEGPGIISENYFIDSEEVSLVSKEGYLLALRNAMSKGDSSVIPYLDITGAKKYESYNFKLYTSFSITSTTPALSRNYTYPKTGIFSKEGGSLILKTSVEYTEYNVSGNVITPITSGVLSAREAVGIQVENLSTEQYPDFSYSFNEEGIVIRCSEADTNDQLTSILRISLRSYDRSTNEVKTIYPTGLRDGYLRIIQNENTNWRVKYEETEYTENNSPLYLFDYKEGRSKDIVISTSIFNSKDDFNISVNGNSEEWNQVFEVSIYSEEEEEYNSYRDQLLRKYISQIENIESIITSSYVIRDRDTEGLGDKVKGRLGTCLKYIGTYNTEYYNLLLEVNKFCTDNQDYINQSSTILPQLDEMIKYFSDKIDDHPSRTLAFKNVLSGLIATKEEFGVVDYSRYHQYMNLLELYDKNSFEAGYRALVTANSVNRDLYPCDNDAEISEYLLRKDLTNYFSKLYYYLLIMGSPNGKIRYEETMRSLITAANSDSNSTTEEGEGGVNTFYFRVTTISENDSFSYWRPRILPGDPILLTITASNNDYTGIAQAYFIQKPATVSLTSVGAGNNEEKTSLLISYPQDNGVEETDSFRLKFDPTELKKFGYSGFRWALYSKDDKLDININTGIVTEDYSDIITVSTSYQSDLYERYSFDKLVFIAIGITNTETDPIEITPEDIETNWRHNLYLTRHSISVEERGYKPIINLVSSELRLGDLGYYSIDVVGNCDVEAVPPYNELEFVGKTVSDDYTEDDEIVTTIYFKYTGLTDQEINNPGEIGINILSDDLDYWEVNNDISIPIVFPSDVPSTYRGIIPEEDILFIQLGHGTEVKIDSPHRRVLGSTLSSDINVSDPIPFFRPLIIETEKSTEDYQGHTSTISVKKDIAATRFPISSSLKSRVEYRLAGTTETRIYDVYVLPNTNFIVVSGLSNPVSYSGIVFLDLNKNSTSSITINKLDGVTITLGSTGTDYTISELDPNQLYQTLTFTANSKNNTVADKILGTITLTGFVSGDSIIEGEVLDSPVIGDVYNITIVQRGLHGQIGLGNDNAIVLPIEGISSDANISEKTVGTILRPSSEYQLTLEWDRPGDYTAMIGEWNSKNTSAPLLISGIPARDGYIPSLTYPTIGFGWNGIYETKAYARLTIKAGDLYSEVHNVIQPGINSGTVINHKMYLSPTTLHIPVEGSEYVFTAGEYSTAYSFDNQIGQKIYPSCSNGAIVSKNNSPGEIIISLPENLGQYSILVGNVTLVLDKLDGTYKVSPDGSLEIGANGMSNSLIYVDGVIPKDLRFNQLMIEGGDIAAGYVGEDKLVNVFMSPNVGTTVRTGKIEILIPGQTNIAGEIDYIQQFAYTTIRTDSINFELNLTTSNPVTITQGGQTNNRIPPTVNITGNWPEWTNNGTATIVVDQYGNYGLIYSFTIIDEVEARSFSLSGEVKSTFINGGTYSTPFTQNFIYIPPTSGENNNEG